MSSRSWVQLDPPGYHYTEEPGFHWHIYGDQVLGQLSPKDGAAPAWDYKLWNPPGSEWLLPRPRQFRRDWHLDAQLAQHVIPFTSWTFMPGANQKEWEFTRRPDGTTYPANNWITVPRVPETGSLGGINFTNLAAAAQVTFSATPQVVCFTNSTPVGASLLDLHDYAPYFQTTIYPEPDTLRIFGWGNLCLLIYRTVVYLLKTPAHDGQTWLLLGKWNIGPSAKGLHAPNTQGGMMSYSPMTMDSHAVAVVPVGSNVVCLCFGGSGAGSGGTVSVKLEGVASEGNFWAPGGPWWVAAVPKTKLHFQCQVIGYEEVNTLSVGNPAQPIMFDTGETYKPTINPYFNFQPLIHTQAAESPVITGAGTMEIGYSSASSGESMTVRLAQEDGTAWSSDGSNHSGGLGLAIFPSTPGGLLGGYLTPQLQYLQKRFPVKLTARDVNSTTFDDTQFMGWDADASLRDPLGKRVTIDFFDNAAALLADYETRSQFPVHILRDANGDGTPDTVEVAAWVTNPELTVHKMEGPGLAAPIQVYRLTAHALLSRADQPYLYLPQMVDPVNIGQVEHGFAVAETLRQCGFDVADSDVAQISADPSTGMDIARLPGQPHPDRGAVAFQVADPWAPNWDDTKLEYMQRIAKKWRGWLLYESLGQTIYYTRDLVQDRLAGQIAAPTPVAVIYLTQAAAAAALRPGDYCLTEPERLVEDPVANVVRFIGKDSDGKLTPNVIRKYLDGITGDPDSPHFTGEYRIHAVVDEWGIGSLALTQLAAVGLRRLLRRKVFWTFVVPKAPWEVGTAGLYIGQTFTLTGRGDYQVVRLHVECLKSSATASVYRTRYTGEFIPAPVDAV